MTRVLIAVDDSESSVAAARTAHRLFGDDADYIVLNVAENHPVKWGDDALMYGTVYPLAVPGAGVIGGIPLIVHQPGASPDDDRVESAEQTADNIAHDAGVNPVESLGETGDPVEAILTAAERHRADVIVVGSHDRGWFRSLFSTSVRDELIRDAEVPVLVAR
ncbi:MAG TPA: universal stress protein [Ilumatobacteraceae bacterium]|jgi:nucleotide-binding universal stress UspA family protein